MEFTTIIYEIKEQVALFTLNRPDRMNAWNGTMAAELSNALDSSLGTQTPANIDSKTAHRSPLTAPLTVSGLGNILLNAM